jgi:hypothetical protein
LLHEGNDDDDDNDDNDNDDKDGKFCLVIVEDRCGLRRRGLAAMPPPSPRQGGPGYYTVQVTYLWVTDTVPMGEA